MSYLLDALKQSEQHDEASAHDRNAEQLKQQQELQRYRFIAISLGLLVAFLLTLMAGFSIGKWLQKNHFNTPEQVVTTVQDQSVEPADDKTPVPATVKPEQSIPVQTNPVQTSPAQVASTQPMSQPQFVQPQQYQQAAGQYQWVQVPVNTAPAYPQGQPMLVQTPNGYQQVYAAPQQQYNPNAVQMQPMINNSASNIDMSKYKVLGKPIGEPTSEKSKPEATVSDEELETVPTALKNAFARAIEDTQSTQSHQVTQGTKNSSYAEPIELLPDALLALMPEIKYQAHIYSSSPDKRWVKLNNRELYEGDSIGDLRVLEITPEQTVLSFDDYEFSLKALQDWPE
ncbi:general secretion pathway protein GspB [Pseudoalteromonas sp. SR44-5]|uniref:general secretion pathway protein GspB n=1 Tax=Pseudoalteromonas TaxID=53246 RepID=UPI001603B555|nr:MULTISPECIES: general secretion pathway protein GspB [unclassified Pseudoalteromonas]MBB1333754.1 general secretion pathway protein GspB [Pseudoalteromonas sp. SR41-6]MBB1341811.1 general secretion pathway protein GspB [Pseudoalteromonas sp. SR45-6]MBB1367007.1 general secretion pathway protein GspB [Pseudoalteromonas sp. SR44-5]MBB1435194.1 general secretion pathway protein GspB [Pseudoalteromonas sp. SG43-6]MBB1459475.1 general secretion pathway protein GspB [Pseudoalteromonas sp. SG41-8]